SPLPHAFLPSQDFTKVLQRPIELSRQLSPAEPDSFQPRAEARRCPHVFHHHSGRAGLELELEVGLGARARYDLVPGEPGGRGVLEDFDLQVGGAEGGADAQVPAFAFAAGGAVDADRLAAREPVGGAVRVGEQVEDPIDRRGDDTREGDGGGTHGGLQPTRMSGKGVWGFSGHGTSRAWGSGEVGKWAGWIPNSRGFANIPISPRPHGFAEGTETL